MSGAELVRAFERGDIADADFHHASHLRLGLAYLEDSASVDEAIDRMAAALKRFAAAAGKAEKYHHTVTVFWMRMLARLLDKSLPLAYYSTERLFSGQARRTWVEPDIQSLDGQITRSPDNPPARAGDPSRHAPHRSLPR